MTTTDLALIALAGAQTATLGLLLLTRMRVRKSMASIVTLFDMTHQTIKYLLELNDKYADAIISLRHDTEFLRSAIQVIDQRND